MVVDVVVLVRRVMQMFWLRVLLATPRADYSREHR